MFLSRLPHADVKILLFAPDAARSVSEKTNTTSKQTKHKKTEKRDNNVFPLLVCLMSSYVTQQLLFIK